jgi:hypothetical protein
VPFDEGLAVQACELDGHNRFRHHLLDRVGRHRNDGGHVAVFEPIKVSFDWLSWVPGRGKERIVGVSFCR